MTMSALYNRIMKKTASPKIKERAMSHGKPFFETGNDQSGALVEGWKEIAIEKLGEIADSNRGFRLFLDSCVKCGACTDKCHYFLGTGDPLNMPVARQDLIRGVYRRYHTLSGQLFPRFVGAVDLTEELIEDWSTYLYQCSECRRCSVFCPFGIDTAEVTMAGRSILDAVGLKQKYIHAVLANVHKIGNNLGMIGPAIADTLESLEEEVEEDTGVNVRFPLDEPNAEVLLVVPSADLYTEPHVDGLIGCAKIFHQAGVRWTMATEASEAANFGLFVGNDSHMSDIAERILTTAQNLGASQIVIGECGHAWRVASSYWRSLFKDGMQGFEQLPEPVHICEYTHGLITEGRVHLDRTVHDSKVITFHDSCNVARGSKMGNQPRDIYRIPRELLKAACENFVDMAPDTICENTFCCGGGGGLLTDELIEVRVSGASPRVHALEQVIEKYGVTHMAAICAICKSQFRTVLPHYGLGTDMIVSLHQILGDAVVLN